MIPLRRAPSVNASPMFKLEVCLVGSAADGPLPSHARRTRERARALGRLAVRSCPSGRDGLDGRPSDRCHELRPREAPVSVASLAVRPARVPASLAVAGLHAGRMVFHPERGRSSVVASPPVFLAVRERGAGALVFAPLVTRILGCLVVFVHRSDHLSHLS